MPIGAVGMMAWLFGAVGQFTKFKFVATLIIGHSY